MRSNTDWFRDAKWGVFTHYLTATETSVTEWNDRVDRFDTVSLAEQLHMVGASYYFRTIGQNSGHYCSPNATCDSITGIKPSKCSERDLVTDLYHTLEPYGIKLMVYIPSGAPDRDKMALERLGWRPGFKNGWGSERTGERLSEFQIRWEAVLREWSLRWGDKVCGWWIDGCYFADAMYRYPEPPNFQSFAAAMKAGNPECILAFNPGVLTPIISLTEYEDYTAGEISEALPVCPGRWVNDAQYHILSYLGKWWCVGPPRFTDEFVLGYTKDVTSKGRVVTWDAPITSEGLIPQPFIKQLMVLHDL